MQILESIPAVCERIKNDRSRATAKEYGYALRRFAEYLEQDGLALTHPTEALTVEHFRKFPSWLSGLKKSKSTVNVCLAAIKFYYEWLVDERLIAAPDYSDTLRIQKAIQKIRKKRGSRMVRFPKTGQAEALVDAVDKMSGKSPMKERNKALVRLLHSSGCRNSEAAKLKIGDVDLDERMAVVIGKGNEQRRIFFSQETVMALREYWSARGWALPNDPVFARHDRRAGKKHICISTTTVRDVVDAACAIAGIPKGKFTPHHFRHAYAMTVLRETGNLALVQDLLGHKDAGSTRVYAKIDVDDLRDQHHQIYE